MSSVIARPNGHFWIQFRLDNKRRTLRLGKTTRHAAETIQRHIDDLLVSRSLNVPLDASTKAWVTGTHPDLADRLCRVGLLSYAPIRSIEGLLNNVLSTSRVSESTAKVHHAAARMAREFFGPNTPLADVTKEDCERFREWLLRQGASDGSPLSPATVSSRGKQVAQWFGHAHRRGWISENPFAGVAFGPRKNASRQRFVSMETIRTICAHLDPETALMVILGRVGGLRIPSEAMALMWEHVDWARGIIRIPCVKTSRYSGKEIRETPLFPGLREAMNAAWDRAEPGQVYVLKHRQITGAGIHRRVERAVLASGIEVWPRLLQNLRSSRETELNDRFPTHVVAGWLGHSPVIAERHYLQITKEHLASALREAKPEALE